MTTWITQREAGEILGVHKSRVAKLVAEGQLTPRPSLDHRASLDRAEVLALAEWRAGAHERRLAQRKAREVERDAARTWGRPPDAEHDWLSTAQAAEVLGVSRVAVNKRINRGHLPFSEIGGRRWVRRDLLELVERARRARRTRST